MKILILTSKYNNYSATIINHLLQTQKNLDIVLGLSGGIYSNKKSLFSEVRSIYKKQGPLFLFYKFKLLIITKLHALLRSFSLLTKTQTKIYYSVKELGYKNIIYFDDINENDSINRIKEEGFDLVLSIGFTQIIKKQLLHLDIKYGFVNLHPSLLPNYSGCMPSFWVLYNKETKTGVTLHRMEEKVDEGGIYLSGEVEVSSEENLNTLKIKTAYKACDLLDDFFERIEEYACKSPIQQNSKNRTYYPMPNKQKHNLSYSVLKRIL